MRVIASGPLMCMHHRIARDVHHEMGKHKPDVANMTKGPLLGSAIPSGEDCPRVANIGNHDLVPPGQGNCGGCPRVPLFLWRAAWNHSTGSARVLLTLISL